MRIDAFFYVTATDEVLQSNCYYIVAVDLKNYPKKFFLNFLKKLLTLGKCFARIILALIQSESVQTTWRGIEVVITRRS